MYFIHFKLFLPFIFIPYKTFILKGHRLTGVCAVRMWVAKNTEKNAVEFPFHHITEKAFIFVLC